MMMWIKMRMRMMRMRRMIILMIMIMLTMNTMSSLYLCRCAMAIVHSRFGRVIYGTENNVMGGLDTHFNIHAQKSINHHFEVFKGLMSDECKKLLV